MFHWNSAVQNSCGLEFGGPPLWPGIVYELPEVLPVQGLEVCTHGLVAR